MNTVNRYFQLRTNLHINAASEADPGNTNKFWKVVVDAVQNRCRQLPREELSSIYEQMVPFTGRVPANQFIKSKPNPVGVNRVKCVKCEVLLCLNKDKNRFLNFHKK